MLKGKKNMSKSNVFGTMSHKAFITTEKNIVKWAFNSRYQAEKRRKKKGENKKSKKLILKI